MVDYVKCKQVSAYDTGYIRCCLQENEINFFAYCLIYKQLIFCQSNAILKVSLDNTESFVRQPSWWVVSIKPLHQYTGKDFCIVFCNFFVCVYFSESIVYQLSNTKALPMKYPTASQAYYAACSQSFLDLFWSTLVIGLF